MNRMSLTLIYVVKKKKKFTCKPVGSLSMDGWMNYYYCHCKKRDRRMKVKKANSNICKLTLSAYLILLRGKTESWRGDFWKKGDVYEPVDRTHTNTCQYYTIQERHPPSIYHIDFCDTLTEIENTVDCFWETKNRLHT